MDTVSGALVNLSNIFLTKDVGFEVMLSSVKRWSVFMGYFVDLESDGMNPLGYGDVGLTNSKACFLFI